MIRTIISTSSTRPATETATATATTFNDDVTAAGAAADTSPVFVADV